MLTSREADRGYHGPPDDENRSHYTSPERNFLRALRFFVVVLFSLLGLI